MRVNLTLLRFIKTYLEAKKDANEKLTQLDNAFVSALIKTLNK